MPAPTHPHAQRQGVAIPALIPSAACLQDGLQAAECVVARQHFSRQLQLPGHTAVAVLHSQLGRVGSAGGAGG